MGPVGEAAAQASGKQPARVGPTEGTDVKARRGRAVTGFESQGVEFERREPGQR